MFVYLFDIYIYICLFNYLEKSHGIHNFVINHHFDHELTPENYLEFEILSRAFRWS